MTGQATVNAPPVLKMFAVWLDKSGDQTVKRHFQLSVFVDDDTVALTELTEGFNHQLFLRRVLLPRPSSGLVVSRL